MVMIASSLGSAVFAIACILIFVHRKDVDVQALVATAFTVVSYITSAGIMNFLRFVILTKSYVRHRCLHHRIHHVSGPENNSERTYNCTQIGVPAGKKDSGAVSLVESERMTRKAGGWLLSIRKIPITYTILTFLHSHFTLFISSRICRFSSSASGSKGTETEKKPTRLHSSAPPADSSIKILAPGI